MSRAADLAWCHRGYIFTGSDDVDHFLRLASLGACLVGNRAVLPFSSQCICKQCRSEIRWTRRKAMLQLDSWDAPENAYRGCEHRYCGKEFKRKLEQGPVDHEVEFKCKVYENGRVMAGPETLRQLSGFSERQIGERTGVHRNTIRLIRHGQGVKRSTYEKVISFLRESRPAATEH